MWFEVKSWVISLYPCSRYPFMWRYSRLDIHQHSHPATRKEPYIGVLCVSMCLVCSDHYLSFVTVFVPFWVWWNRYSEKPFLHSPIPLATSCGQTAGPVGVSLGWMSEAGLDPQMVVHMLKLGTGKTLINWNSVFRSVWKELSLVIKCHNLCFFYYRPTKQVFGLEIHSI